MMKRCCCCCPLRRGSAIIASLTLVLGLLGVLYGIYWGIRDHKEGWALVAVSGANLLLAIFLTVSLKRLDEADNTE
ncbi:uncharacterized protein [Panulirus ornatus]|uniref:uncharacterized protein isoform X2 n=1 Tax=Panulirus ornatus TaxID=150431 RepID=UPI003A89E837